MAKTDFQSVDEYIATHPENVRATLERVRAIIRKALPDAEEGISYHIPTYRVRGTPVIYFAGWKQHYSLYPVRAPLVKALGDELASFEISKGTIRFPLSERVPGRLIGRIAKLLAQEAAERSKGKPAKPKRRK
jgi:uncharacterized protein YdhG (YjbR/CyaY superfamily)